MCLTRGLLAISRLWASSTQFTCGMMNCKPLDDIVGLGDEALIVHLDFFIDALS